MTGEKNMPEVIDRIDATLECASSGYAVHVGCGGECTPTSSHSGVYICHRCDRKAPRDFVVERCGESQWAKRYERDVRMLRDLLSELGVVGEL